MDNTVLYNHLEVWFRCMVTARLNAMSIPAEATVFISEDTPSQSLSLLVRAEHEGIHLHWSGSLPMDEPELARHIFLGDGYGPLLQQLSYDAAEEISIGIVQHVMTRDRT